MAQCVARSTTSGNQCKNHAIKGGTVCTRHGGLAPQVRAAAARRLEMAEAEEAVRAFALPLDISPADALLGEVQWTAGHVATLRRMIEGYTTDDLTWGKHSETEKRSGEFPGTDTVHQAAPPVLVQLYAEERKHLVAVCSAALKAGVEERRVRLAERQGDLVADVIEKILDALNLTAEQQALIPEVVPAQLRLLAGGAQPA